MKQNQLTQPYKVGINSTCSGAWPVIYETCRDPETGEEWNREIAAGNSVFVETEEHRSRGKAETWNENPSAFGPADGCDKNISIAYQLAAAPMMAHVLDAVIRSRTVSPGLKALAHTALEAAMRPAVLPQADPEAT